jgi:hypothetical protein
MTPFQLFRTIALALILPAASGAPTFAQTGVKPPSRRAGKLCLRVPARSDANSCNYSSTHLLHGGLIDNGALA